MATRCPQTGRFNTFQLADDGTMDTVLTCSECGREMRYNYAAMGLDEINAETELTDADNESHYNEFVEASRQDAAEAHEAEEED